MREILFRGKDADYGEWVYGYYAHLKNMHDVKADIIYTGYADMYMGSILPEYYEVNPETVGQYTGLKDKNGTRVFEGDILHVEQCGETGSRISPVYFGEYIDADSVFDNYCCIGFYVKTSDGCCTIGALLSEEFECEVIGNIHDNPELMGGNTHG